MSTSPALEAGRPAILRRTLGSKAIKMVFSERARRAARCARWRCRRQSGAGFSITDAEVEELARYALIIEKHYGRPMDIEWGRDGADGKLYILQARPETVKANVKHDSQQRYRLKQRSEVLVSGRAIGNRVGRRAGAPGVDASEMARVEPGDVLVTDMTDPDWEPVMKRAVGHRHQPRRAHLPRCHHRARAGHSGGSGLRRRHQEAARG